MRIYCEAETATQIMADLIRQHHTELATARIRVVHVDKAGTKGGRPVLYKARKLSGVLLYLIDVHFLIELPMDTWNEMSDDTRRAVMDQALECCTGTPDEQTGDMVWAVREPDVQEYLSVLRRNGAWNDSLQALVTVAKEIDVDSVDTVVMGHDHGSVDVTTPLDGVGHPLPTQTVF